jgi:hypothetical protein
VVVVVVVFGAAAKTVPVISAISGLDDELTVTVAQPAESTAVASDAGTHELVAGSHHEMVSDDASPHTVKAIWVNELPDVAETSK